jgi:hypothetical protein
MAADVRLAVVLLVGLMLLLLMVELMLLAGLLLLLLMVGLTLLAGCWRMGGWKLVAGASRGCLLVAGSSPPR